jgi:hypothetical protein
MYLIGGATVPVAPLRANSPNELSARRLHKGEGGRSDVFVVSCSVASKSAGKIFSWTELSTADAVLTFSLSASRLNLLSWVTRCVILGIMPWALMEYWCLVNKANRQLSIGSQAG